MSVGDLKMKLEMITGGTAANMEIVAFDKEDKVSTARPSCIVNTVLYSVYTAADLYQICTVTYEGTSIWNSKTKLLQRFLR